MNIVDLESFKEKKASREQLKETLSNPMKSLVKSMIKQSFRESSDEILTKTMNEFRDGKLKLNLNEGDIKELLSYMAEEFIDLAEAIEYINNMEEL